MNQKSNSLSFFITAFIITAAVIVSVCLIASLELKNNSFHIDLETMTAKLFGRTYTLNKTASDVLCKILDFNKNFVGKQLFDSIKSGIIQVFQVILDLFRIIFYSINSIVNASALSS